VINQSSGVPDAKAGTGDKAPTNATNTSPSANPAQTPSVAGMFDTRGNRMPSASLADVIDAYRAKHPGDHLSTVRAARALTAGPDVMGGCTDLNGSPLNLSVASHEDAVVAQMDRAREVTS